MKVFLAYISTPYSKFIKLLFLHKLPMGTPGGTPCIYIIYELFTYYLYIIYILFTYYLYTIHTFFTRYLYIIYILPIFYLYIHLSYFICMHVIYLFPFSHGFILTLVCVFAVDLFRANSIASI